MDPNPPRYNKVGVYIWFSTGGHYKIGNVYLSQVSCRALLHSQGLWILQRARQTLTTSSCVSTSSLPTSSGRDESEVVLAPLESAGSSSGIYGHHMRRWLVQGAKLDGRLTCSRRVALAEQSGRQVNNTVIILITAENIFWCNLTPN